MSHLLPMLLFEIFVKMTLLLLAAWAACRALRRASAAVRHLIWSAALGGVLLLPLLSLSLPAWNVTWKQATVVPSPVPSRPTIVSEYTPQSPVADTVPSGNSASEQPVTAVPNVQGAELAAPKPNKSLQFMRPCNLEAAALCVWLLGFLSVLVPLAVGLRRIRLWERAARRLEEDTLRIAEAARQQIGLRRPVRFLRVVEGAGVSVPVTWGLLRPVVLLPASSRLWSEDCLRAALLHELAHIQRGDWLTQLGASLTCALYWWHPLVWGAARLARAESERACDDRVLMTGMGAPDYAQGLIEVVRSLPAGARSSRVAVAMAQPSEVEGRVRAVLTLDRDRSHPSRRRLALVMTAAVLLLLPLSVLRPLARAEAVKTVSGGVEQAGAYRREHGFLKFVYLNDVATDTDPKRPWTLTTSRDGRYGGLYIFSDMNTGQSFRDGAQIQAAFDKLLAQGGKPRPGAEPYLVPLLLSVGLPTRHVFFTPDQRRNTAALEKEKKAWDRLIQRSPLILTDADIAPRTTAYLNSQKPPTPVVDIHYTPKGAKKMMAFSAAHQGEIMGIIVDDGLLTAPLIRETIKDDEGEISGGFHTLTEAQALARRLNTSSGAAKLPPSSDGSPALDDSSAAHIALGLRLRQKGRWRDSILEFRRAVQLDPNDAGAHALLAQALYAQVTGPSPQRDEAINQMQKAVALQPESSPSQMLLGSYLGIEHRWAEMIPHARRALELLEAAHAVKHIYRAAANGNNPNVLVFDSLYALCDALVKKGDYRDAALHYLQAMTAATGDLYAGMGQYPQAVENYRKALEFDEFTTYVLFAQGETLRKEGQIPQARTDWKKVLAIDPPGTYYHDQAQARLAKYR